MDEHAVKNIKQLIEQMQRGSDALDTEIRLL
jgi:hypothetical protein